MRDVQPRHKSNENLVCNSTQKKLYIKHLHFEVDIYIWKTLFFSAPPSFFFLVCAKFWLFGFPSVHPFGFISIRLFRLRKLLRVSKSSNRSNTLHCPETFFGNSNENSKWRPIVALESILLYWYEHKVEMKIPSGFFFFLSCKRYPSFVLAFLTTSTLLCVYRAKYWPPYCLKFTFLQRFPVSSTCQNML